MDDESELSVYSAEEKKQKNEPYQKLEEELTSIIINNKVKPTDGEAVLGPKLRLQTGCMSMFRPLMTAMHWTNRAMSQYQHQIMFIRSAR